MKIKPKGRKIYRRKDRFERMKAIRHSTGSVILTVFTAGVLGFVGYSAGAPVLAFLQEQNFLALPSQYKATEATEISDIETILDSETESDTTENIPETESTTEAETVAETEEQLGFVQKAPDLQGYVLDTSALLTETALQAALENLPEDISHVILPLKINGGEIYYATSVRDAVRTGAVQAAVPLEKMYQLVSQKGYEPVALVNTLQDDIYARAYPDASYKRMDTGELWTDESSAQERVWLSPESTLTQDYLSEITAEIEAAGFRIMICEGLEFPNFPRSDLSGLDTICSDANRYQALADVLAAMRASSSEIAVFVIADGDDILYSDMETIYAAEALPADCLLVTMNEENSKSYKQLKDVSMAVPVIIEWQGDTLPENIKLKSYVLNPKE